MPSATNQQKIAALYAAVFNRAPDTAGFEYWYSQMLIGKDLNALSEAFATHPTFISTYGSLSNEDFVKALYQNILGRAGEASGVGKWVSYLNAGASRAKLVSDFVSSALTVDLDSLKASGAIDASTYDAAKKSQQSITNKANVGVAYATQLKAATTAVTSTDTSDPGYAASISILSMVTDAADTVARATKIINDLANDATVVSPATLNATINKALIAPSAISYSAVTISENSQNDGKIDDTITISISGGGLFAGPNGSSIGTVTNVPPGLTAKITKVSDTLATLSFTGTAINSNSSNNVYNVKIEFKDADFSNTKAQNVTGAVKSDFSIIFIDDIPYSEVNSSITMSAPVSGNVSLDLTQHTFTINSKPQTLASGSLSNVLNLDATYLTGGSLTFIGDNAANICKVSAQGSIVRGLGGDDILTANKGVDKFIFEATAQENGVDTIYDFTIGAGGDILDFSKFLNLTGKKNIAAVSALSTAAKKWLNGDVLVASGTGLMTPNDIASLFGAGKAFAAPTDVAKAVLITADVVGDATVWYIVNQSSPTSIESSEVFKVATLVGVNNLALVGFDATNLA